MTLIAAQPPAPRYCFAHLQPSCYTFFIKHAALHLFSGPLKMCPFGKCEGTFMQEVNISKASLTVLNYYENLLKHSNSLLSERRQPMPLMWKLFYLRMLPLLLTLSLLCYLRFRGVFFLLLKDPSV